MNSCSSLKTLLQWPHPRSRCSFPWLASCLYVLPLPVPTHRTQARARTGLSGFLAAQGRGGAGACLLKGPGNKLPARLPGGDPGREEGSLAWAICTGGLGVPTTGSLGRPRQICKAPAPPPAHTFKLTLTCIHTQVGIVPLILDSWAAPPPRPPVTHIPTRQAAGLGTHSLLSAPGPQTLA